MEHVEHLNYADLTKEERTVVDDMRRQKRKELKPRLSREYTEAEKVAAFDVLHQMALNHYEEVIKDGRGDDDCKNWFFEAVMELLSRPDQPVWKTYNKAMR